MVYVGLQARFSFLDIEPLSIPSLERCVERHLYVFLHHAIPQLQINSADNFGGPRSKEGFEAEEIAKEVEVQGDSDECFTQIDEEGDMKNVVGMELAKVNVVVAKKFPQERMRRNPKSMNEISLEYNKFICIRGRERFTYSGAPSYGCLILKDTFEHHFF